MPIRMNLPSMFTRSAKPLTPKGLKGGPSGKEESKLQSTSKEDPRETAKGKNDAGEVKKERVTLRQLLDKERQEELEQAQKAKLQQPEVKEERKTAGSQSPESLRASQPEMDIKALMRKHGFEPTQRFKPEAKQALLSIPEGRAIVYETKPTITEDFRTLYREVPLNKPEVPLNKSFKQKVASAFTQPLKSAMQTLSRTFTGSFTRSTTRN